EKRTAKRMMGVSEISLSVAGGRPSVRASIINLSEGGMFLAYLQPSELTDFNIGQAGQFDFMIPTGRVKGNAKVARLVRERGKLALQLMNIENEDGLTHLRSFLHSWFCGVD